MTTVEDMRKLVFEAVKQAADHDLIEPEFTVKEPELVGDDTINVEIELRGQMAAQAQELQIEQQILRSMDIVGECERQLARTGGPEVEVVRGIVKAFYARPGNGAGGRLHVQLDDGNLEDHFLDAGEQERLADEPEALALMRVLAAMPWRKRWRVYAGGEPDALETMEDSLEG